MARPPAVASESSDAALAPDILLTDCFSPAQPPPPLPDPLLLPPPPCCDTGRGLTGPPMACSIVVSCPRQDTPHAALTPHEGASASRQQRPAQREDQWEASPCWRLQRPS